MEQKFTTFKIQEVVHVKRENMRIKTDCKETYVLSCRLSGESMFFYKGDAKKVIPGDVLYIPYGANYSQSCQAEEIVAIHLDVNGDMPKEMQIITTEDPEEMCLLFGEIAQAWKAKTIESFYGCMANLYKIVALTHIADDSCAKETYGELTRRFAICKGICLTKIWLWTMHIGCALSAEPVLSSIFASTSVAHR